MKNQDEATPVIAGAYHGDNNIRYTSRPKTTDEQKAEALAKTVKDEPKNYVMLKHVFLEASKMGIPSSVIMRAIGGNRGVGEPKSDNWRFVYYKRSRWLPKACLKDLPKMVQSEKPIGRPPKPRAVKPIAKVQPKPKAQPAEDEPFISKFKQRQMKEQKVKAKAKVKPEDMQGVPVKLKPKPKMTTEQAMEDLGFAPEPETVKPVKSKKSAKLNTTRTKRTVNEAGIPVLDLIDQ